MDPLLRVDDLRVHFPLRRSPLGAALGRRRGSLKAVDGCSLDIAKGEIVGLVGESGSGKSTFGRAIIGLEHARSGRILFGSSDLAELSESALRAERRRIQMIFQDPHASLSPRLSVAYLLSEPYRIHGIPPERRKSATDLLAMVELGPEHALKYPHQLSGGQARRVGIARALALEPALIIADEPTAGLDVSAAAAILNLLVELSERVGLSLLLITHDLNTVSFAASRIAVMYLGRLVEIGQSERLFAEPRHPYTKALLAASPSLEPAAGARSPSLIEGEIPSPLNPPAGCRFHTRCPHAVRLCREREPALEADGGGTLVACHRWREIS